MHFIIVSALLVIPINAGLGNHTGITPWYYKPTRVPTQLATEEPAEDDHRSKRAYDWLGEIENRHNHSSTTHQPPVEPQGPTEYQCPQDVIHDVYNGKGYFFSWEDSRTSKLKIPWLQAVNFCRARCLELVSVETPKEHDFLAKHIKARKIKGVWTSGRKCDFQGCENRPELQPTDIYGWYWEGSRIILPPTTDRFDVLWSQTGPHGKPQPDNSEGKKGGESESCLAILNNAYRDGVLWHDEACSKRKPFICEERDPYYKTEVKAEETPHNFRYYIIQE